MTIWGQFPEFPQSSEPPVYERTGEWLEVAAAAAVFWKDGAGPTQASLSSAFGLSGYDDGGPERAGNKQKRVQAALRVADKDLRRRLLEEVIGLLRNEEELGDNPRTSQLREALSRQGIELTADGFLNWPDDGPGKPAPTATTVAPVTPALVEGSTNFVEERVPSLDFLVAILRRLPSIARPLRKPRRQRPGLTFNDEWAVQDLVESILRGLFLDVRNEEPGPAFAGSSSRIDFLVREAELGIELKVTAPGRNEVKIKEELLRDFQDYRQHPKVRQLLVVVVDLADTFTNPDGFAHDLTRTFDGLAVRTIVIGPLSH